MVLLTEPVGSTCFFILNSPALFFFLDLGLLFPLSNESVSSLMSFSNLLMFNKRKLVVTELCLLIHQCIPVLSIEPGTWQGLKYISLA